DQIKNKINSLFAKTNCYPRLSTIFIGGDLASDWYNKSIKKACEKVGIEYEIFEYDSIGLDKATDLINRLNNDSKVNGILINQPLPENVKYITEMIDPEKDIEGITAKSLGKLLLNHSTHVPCTPLAVMKLIDEYKINLTGQKICILGRSNIVGKPLSIILTQRNATVTLCHSKTKDLEKEIYSADIVIAAIGKVKFVKGDWIRKDTIVIDVGTNYTDNGLVGDVDFDSAKDKASMITPVPGGVGSLTNVILLSNCLDAFTKQSKL
ncbi:MAG: bifunctional 5,10-methylenetetrahydrofolate dehydrogenase/5,10-methenyltetrahydrofolate cyclohydrolase, partial [Spirochaetota bacterium]|nr:bifunctional 5,10-methylenetetrahydrofolate dehydrogenase/5,10-methenyltetrahydrofolate cyclohydrolase [Spirochaetota bacterium]